MMIFGIYQKKPELIPEYQNTLKKDIFQKFIENKLDFLLIYKNKISNILLRTQGIDLGIPLPPSFKGVIMTILKLREELFY